jgi:hypothetical protein
LQPCIAEVYHEEAQEFVNDQFYEKKRTVSVVQKEVSSFFNKKHCKLMQTRYLKKLLSPKCVIEKSQYFVSVLESSYVLSECEESSSEDEIFLGDLVDNSVPRAVAHKRSIKKQTKEPKATKQLSIKKPRVSLDYLENYNAEEEEERRQKFAEKWLSLTTFPITIAMRMRLVRNMRSGLANARLCWMSQSQMTATANLQQRSIT